MREPPQTASGHRAEEQLEGHIPRHSECPKKQLEKRKSGNGIHRQRQGLLRFGAGSHQGLAAHPATTGTAEKEKKVGPRLGKKEHLG